MQYLFICLHTRSSEIRQATGDRGGERLFNHESSKRSTFKNNKSLRPKMLKCCWHRRRRVYSAGLAECIMPFGVRRRAGNRRGYSLIWDKNTALLTVRIRFLFGSLSSYYSLNYTINLNIILPLSTISWLINLHMSKPTLLPKFLRL